MDDLNIGMFKAYDIRTKAEYLDDRLAARLVSSIGHYIVQSVHASSVILGRDARIHGPRIMELMLEIFPSLGLDVLVNPLQISTCQFYYTCMQYPDAAAVMITASHNPGSYIGCKLLAPKLEPIAMGSGPDGGILAIKELYLQNQPLALSPTRGRTRIVNEGEHFVDYSLRLAGVQPGSLSGVEILGEFLSGASGTDVAMALDKAGAHLTSRHLVPDGRFPYGDPNPIIESSIAPARKAMRNGSFAFGFCFDGDGDRMDLMDGQGNQVVPGFNMAVLVPEIRTLFAHAFPGKPWNPQFYADVKAIPTALIEIAKAGVGVHLIRNGHSFIKAKLRDNFRQQYLAAEEESAHYYMNFPLDADDWSKGYAATENTLFFMLLTARAWTENPQRYQQVIKIQKGLYREREWPLHFETSPSRMNDIMVEVEREMVRRGAFVIKQMEDGSDLDATLLRFGLPPVIGPETRLDGPWCQVAQRISRSEDAMTRWEVAAGTPELCAEMNGAIRTIADRYVSSGYAHY